MSDIREPPLPGGFEDDLDGTTVEAIEGDGGIATYVDRDVTNSEQVHRLDPLRRWGRALRLSAISGSNPSA